MGAHFEGLLDKLDKKACSKVCNEKLQFTMKNNYMEGSGSATIK